MQKFRVVDDRKLSVLTVRDKYSLSNIFDLHDQLGKCRYFSTFDLMSGLHHLEINPKDIPKTTFTVEKDHYEFVRMPFGV